MDFNSSINFPDNINTSSDEWVVEDTLKIYNSRPTHEIVRICLFFVTFIAGLTLNVMMILQQSLELRTMSRTISTLMPKMMSILLINLGISQILQSFWSSLVDGIWHSTQYWYAGNFMCKLVMFLRRMSITSSEYSVMAVLVGHVIQSQSMTERRFIYLKILLPVWIFSAGFSIPTFFLYNTWRVPFYEAVDQCVNFMSFPSEAAIISYFVADLILTFGAPLIITIVFVIVGIVHRVKGKVRIQGSLLDEEVTPNQDDETEINGPIRISPSKDTGTNIQSKFREKNITPFLLVVMFFTLWMPFFFGVCHSFVTYNYIDQLLPWFYILGHATNPMKALCSIICTKFHV